MDSFNAEAMAHAEKQAAHFRYQRALLDIRIKAEQEAHEDALALHMVKTATPDELKRWSSASTPASARRAIEQEVLEREPMPPPIVSINDLKIEMAGYDYQYGQAKADYEMFAVLAWGGVAELLDRGKVHLMASAIPQELPAVIPTAMPHTAKVVIGG